MTRLERAGLLAALVLAAGLMLPLHGYLTDDTFIHLQYARHLAEGAGPVFNPGERVYGCTSPLWMLLLALAIALGGDGLLAAKVLGGVATLASVVLVFVLARRTLRTPALRVAIALTWAAHAWMIRWALSGMETPLATALVLAGFVALTVPGRAGTRGSGLAWALAALVRPEAALLVLAWGVRTLAGGGAEAPGAWRRARALAPAVVVLGAWLVFARAYYGSFVPHTLSAKAAGSTGLAAIPDNARRIAEIVGVADGVLVLLLVASLAAGARARAEALAGPRLLAWIWVVGLPVLYLARGVPVISRYLVPVSAVAGWLAWWAAEAWWLGARETPHAVRRAASLAVLVTALALAQNLVAWRLVVAPQVASFTRGLEQSLIPIGRWLDAHAPADAAVATPDIGAIGYYARRRVIDLGGLVTPRMVPLLEQAPFDDVLARFAFADFARPDYVLDRGGPAGDLLRRSPYRAALAAVDTAAVPNLGVAHPGRVVYTLYHVDWTRMDAERKRR
ncbi:MAG TPA: hypothetical protein VI792_10615 [Candidatus Eisenbacteria bacterium]